MRLGVFARGPVASQRGVALIFTLMLVVILSAVILAFLITMRADRQQTFSYGNGIKANEMALGALQQIAGNVRGEIGDNSTALTVSGVTVYQPKDRYAVAPLRIGFDANDYGTDADGEKLPPTLLQVSRSGSGSDASEVFSSATSANGRAISPERWNAPLLLSGSQNKVPAAFVEQPPQWIYFTRAGSRLCTDEEARDGSLSAAVLSNTNAVLGRYAFVIYDEGALLDMNVAGFPASGTSTSPTLSAEARGKSAVAYADLTRLPGLDRADGKTLVENFVNWRNKGALSVSGGDYAKAVANSATTGFLQFTGSGGVYDNPLLGRRDLLDYLQKVVGNTAAAPYLSTFSRASLAPVWSPAQNAREMQADGYNSYVTYFPSTARTTAEKTFKYLDNAGLATAINRNLASVRHTKKSDVRHWRDDGTPVTRAVKAGEPLLAGRFSLKRLDWLKNDPYNGTPPDSSLSAAVQACFGLRWGLPGGASNATNGGNPCWNYVGANGSDYPGRIKTLAEVADEGREPDFFELLKAVILNGSLGKHPGQAMRGNGTKSSFTLNGSGDAQDTMGPTGLYCFSLNPLAGGSVPAPAQIPDMHIIQIGANIIDQWDADSYPTAVYFRYAGVGAYDPAGGLRAEPVFGPVCMVFGNENLPYLSKVESPIVTTDRTRTTPDASIEEETDYPEAHKLGGWFQPEIYNPHQAPAEPLTGVPHDFQFRAYGEDNYVKWSWGMGVDKDDIGNYNECWGVRYHYSSGESPRESWFHTNDLNEVCAVGTINLTDSSGTAFYERPFGLRNDPLYPTVSVTSPAAINIARPEYPFWNKKHDSGYTNHFVAFNSGVTDPTDYAPGTKANTVSWLRPFYVKPDTSSTSAQCIPSVLSPSTFIMGWVDKSGGFHPYSYIAGIFGYAYHVMYTDGHTSKGQGHGMGSARPDDLSPCRFFYLDPRTPRFSMFGTFFGAGQSLNTTSFQNIGSPSGGNKGLYPAELGFNYEPVTYPSFVGWGVNYTYCAGEASAQMYPPNNNVFTPSKLAYYADPDGVIRPADGWYANYSTRDGYMLFSVAGAPPKGETAADGDNTVGRHGRRPVILNRPFRSVGELGYVFRDLPFKTLDLFTPYSADAALLDVFSLQDKLTVSAGLLNISNAPRPVLEAILSGAGKKEADPQFNLSGTHAASVARNIASHFTVSGTKPPLASRADLVTVLSGTIRAGLTLSADKANKAYLEAPVRALAEVTDTRTWNLLVDVIAQSGRLSRSANKLEQFIVEGERRYWLHLAIDRYTGQIIDQQLEPVYE